MAMYMANNFSFILIVLLVILIARLSKVGYLLSVALEQFTQTLLLEQQTALKHTIKLNYAINCPLKL